MPSPQPVNMLSLSTGDVLSTFESVRAAARSRLIELGLVTNPTPKQVRQGMDRLYRGIYFGSVVYGHRWRYSTSSSDAGLAATKLLSLGPTELARSRSAPVVSATAQQVQEAAHSLCSFQRLSDAANSVPSLELFPESPARLTSKVSGASHVAAKRAYSRVGTLQACQHTQQVFALNKEVTTLRKEVMNLRGEGASLSAQLAAVKAASKREREEVEMTLEGEHKKLRAEFQEWFSRDRDIAPATLRMDSRALALVITGLLARHPTDSSALHVRLHEWLLARFPSCANGLQLHRAQAAERLSAVPQDDVVSLPLVAATAPASPKFVVGSAASNAPKYEIIKDEETGAKRLRGAP